MDRRAYLRQKNQERKVTHRRFEIAMPKAKAKRFERVAKQEKISPNRLIEQLATAYLDEHYIVPTELKEKLDHHNFLIRNIATNINQIAHASNIFHDAEKQVILKHLDSLNTQVQHLIASLSQSSSNSNL